MGTPVVNPWSDRLSENAHKTIAPPSVRQNMKPAAKAVKAIAILDMRRKPIIGLNRVCHIKVRKGKLDEDLR